MVIYTLRSFRKWWFIVDLPMNMCDSPVVCHSFFTCLPEGIQNQSSWPPMLEVVWPTVALVDGLLEDPMTKWLLGVAPCSEPPRWDISNCDNSYILRWFLGKCHIADVLLFTLLHVGKIYLPCGPVSVRACSGKCWEINPALQDDTARIVQIRTIASQ